MSLSPPETAAARMLPIIDLGGLPPRGTEARRKLALAIDAVARDPGFFMVTGHGVPPAVFDRAFAAARDFFALPNEAKSAIAIERSPCHRGWFALGAENLDPLRQRDGGDLKEGIKIGRDLPPEHPLVAAGIPLHGPNQWPAGLPDFRTTWLEYHRHLQALGLELMSCFALALSLPEDHFDPWLSEPMATAGPLHYPPFSGLETGRLSAGAHTDYGCLTLLAQQELPGLEVLDRQGHWLAVPVVPNALVVNVGDMLARWTNDRYASTVHRVVNRSARDRYSIPYFYDPNHDAPVSCLPGCVSAARPARYPPTTALRHLQERIDSAFGYV
jgi:isopenicillin N synthase-like dioxygenase